MHCDFSPHDFAAVAIRTSDGRLVQVTGAGLCPTAGWELRLVAGGPGFRSQPERLLLELRESPPRPAPRVLTETTVDVTVEDTRAEEVEIRFGWREGFVIPVREAALRRGPRGAMRRRTDAAPDRIAASAV
ncbi:hypothetical protein GCM10023152_14850 [Agromyces bauzanensis]|uniref:Uncharacterized protein n=2 Tax=Agromyces bauzanensis TaxID=1308924 RepID=A0A917UPK2_9MICO|nr:hypothetical protein GCM10011372_08100 [Agromyces bauzanensis]